MLVHGTMLVHGGNWCIPFSDQIKFEEKIKIEEQKNKVLGGFELKKYIVIVIIV